ncbi:hypothetical protein [Flavobacterium sp. AJR]|jgi:hypothetical protein|uniref:hypothetical protein n=1 Tax=Flavobacterium sp. AJR TaxID=1979369 RepID=UPI000A3D7D9A|nr:hypothetical protein [Flavobacterium sp. AJR]OUL63097.1 hypothetical protein B8T70_06805 [Flavobacterium sp. AJR]
MQETVLHNQSLIDFTLHHCGTIESVVAMAVANDWSITEELQPKRILEVPADVIKDSDIVGFYTSKKHVPAFNYSGPISANDEGIGEMIIEETFIVR